MKIFKQLVFASILCCLSLFAMTIETKGQLNAVIKKGDSVIIKLPKPMLKGNMSVEETMATRRSVREYSATDTVLTLDEVSQLLWAAYGVTDSLIKKSKIPDSIRIKNKIPDSVKYKIRKFFLKTAPSAGGLYPLEIYLVAGNVKGLAPGVYKYRPLGHYLLLIQTGDKRKELCTASYDQQMVGKAPISLVYSAVFSRNTKKYEQRGRERYVCMDLGHSGENVYLQATALKMGTCAIGSFEDSDVSKVINMPKEEEPLYIMPVGRR